MGRPTRTVDTEGHGKVTMNYVVTKIIYPSVYHATGVQVPKTESMCVGADVLN